MAGGGDCLAFSTKEPVDVLYVDGELPESQLKQRSRLLVKSERVHYLNPELVGLQRQFNFLATEDQNNLYREIERVGAKAVFLDSQATVMRGDAIDADFHEARNSFPPTSGL
jgi:predicted ATP-dependent serine protease